MSPTSRRIFRYWLLLLVPTLLVGGGAITLLRREQKRLVEQSAEAQESRLTLITSRARLIAESVELLVGDVEEGLLETLSSAPADGIDAFLAQWETGNPLVRTAFRATADGRLLRPHPATTDEDARGFVRRFPRLMGERPPWQAAPAVEEYAKVAETKLQQDENEARKEVSKNVAQVQSARRDVQLLFKNNDYASAPAVAPPMEPGQVGALADTAISGARYQEKAKAEADQASVANSADRGLLASSPRLNPQRARPDSRQVAVAPALRAKDAVAGRRGWVASTIDGRQHAIGWLQGAGANEVRGVEVELAALLSRLGGVMPTEFGGGEGYVLRDQQGRGWHQVGAIPREGTPATLLPLSSALLQGWDVAAFFTTVPAGKVGVGFLGFGVLLVALFVIAIVAGGSLLLWQAQRSEEAAAQKTSFVANVSHEFKTPLTTIRLYAELLEQGRVRDQAQGGDYLRTIGRETQRLARLVNNALDFSRLEQGRKKYAREAIDLSAELARLLDTHAPRVAEAGLTLHRELPAEPVAVTTDRDALEQIVLNLIDNACKYAAEGGEVAVAATMRPGGGAEVRVADRGPGVPVAHRERIFEKFHRVDDALIAEKTGAGLGLSIARQLARGLGGELRYAPREGGGSEFILELP